MYVLWADYSEKAKIVIIDDAKMNFTPSNSEFFFFFFLLFPVLSPVLIIAELERDKSEPRKAPKVWAAGESCTKS